MSRTSTTYCDKPSPEEEETIGRGTRKSRKWGRRCIALFFSYFEHKVIDVEELFLKIEKNKVIDF